MKEQELKGTVKLATFWLLGASFSNQLIRLSSNLILTRLLLPEHFGIMAIVILIWTGFNLLTDAGLLQSVVRSNNEDLDGILGGVFLIQISRGIIISLMVFLLYYFLRLFSSNYFSDEAVYALPDFHVALSVIAFAPLIAGFQSPGIYLLQRNFEQKKILYIEVFSQIIGFISALIFYYFLGKNVLVLAFSALISVFFKMVFSYFFSGFYVFPVYDKEVFVSIFSYGKWIVLSSLMGFLLIGADRIVLSFNVDAEVLGVYSIAAFILLSIKEVVGKFLMHVYFSALSVVKNSGNSLSEYVLGSKVKIDSFLIFLSVLLFIVGNDVIGFLYDDRYSFAGFLLSVLSFTIIGKSSDIVVQYLLVVGKSKFVGFLNLLMAFLCYLFLVSGVYFYGLLGFVYAFVAFEFFRFIVGFFLQFHFFGEIRFSIKYFFMSLFFAVSLGFLCLQFLAFFKNILIFG